MLVEPQTLLLDLAGIAEALRLANQALQRRGAPEAFRMRFVCARPEAASSVGLILAGLEALPVRVAEDSWLVLSGRRHALPEKAGTDSTALADHCAPWTGCTARDAHCWRQRAVAC